MVRKFKAVWELFHKGKVVADPAKWKNRQMESSALIAFIWAAVYAAEVFGYEVPVGSETVDAVAVGLLAGINWVFTLVSSDKVGLPPVDPANPD